MSDDDRNGQEDEFERAMRDVEKLPDRGREALRRRQLRRRTPAPPEQSYEFSVEIYGEQVDGWLVGGNPRWLSELRRGEIQPQAEIDLHRKRRDEARYAVHRFIAESYAHGLRCVLIIHGRGRHSAAEQDAAILKRGVVDWIVEEDVAAQVVAFCTAPPRLGGEGALLVMLRRNKRADGAGRRRR